MIIVLELSKWEEVGPVILPLVDKESEVLFQFLVHPFSLTITLGVVRCGGCKLDPEYSVEFTGELGYKLRPPVGHNFAGQSMMFPDMLDKQASSPDRSDCGEGGHKVGSFSD
jgi:hypothetical protein